MSTMLPSDHGDDSFDDHEELVGELALSSQDLPRRQRDLIGEHGQLGLA
jgi:hypothetical protein